MNLTLPLPVISFPSCLSAELRLLFSSSIRQRLDRALLPLSPPDATCSIYATLAGLSLSSHVPRVLFICFCSSPLPSFIWKGPSSLQTLPLPHLLPLTVNSFSPFSFFSFKFWFSAVEIIFISSWFSSCPLTSHLILSLFALNMSISLSLNSSLH